MTNARIMTVSVLIFEEQETLGRNMKISASPTSCINAHAKKSNKTSSNMIGLVSERKNILRSFLRSWNEIGGPRCEPARWIKFCAVIGYSSGQDGARDYPLCVTLAAHFNNKRALIKHVKELFRLGIQTTQNNKTCSRSLSKKSKARERMPRDNTQWNKPEMTMQNWNGSHTVSRKKNFPESHMINLLLIKLARSRAFYSWGDISQFLHSTEFHDLLWAVYDDPRSGLLLEALKPK